MIRAATYDPRTMALGVGRLLVAVAELTVLVFTPDADLFRQAQGRPPTPRCDGLRAVSLWCAGPDGAALTAGRCVAIVVLLVVASGYRPRWTCVPHWYVTFSLGISAAVSNGGEQAARLLTLLLIPICLGDGRVWQWQRPDARLAPGWRGAGYAGHLVVRAQVLLIYGDALVGKLADAQWRDGTAMHYILQNAYFGAPPELLASIEGPPVGAWLIPLVTWSALAAETFIAVSAVAGPGVRRWALVVGLGLHAGTALALGLISFALVMVGLLTVAAGGRPLARPSTDR